MPGSVDRAVACDQQHDIEAFRASQGLDGLLRGLRDRAGSSVAIGASGLIASRYFTRSLRCWRAFGSQGLARIERWPSARGPVSAAPW
jgi:hypothetical protein